MRLFNTLTRAVETVACRPGEPITMYTCGPTVYRPVHLGNLRSFLLADFVRRALEWGGDPLGTGPVRQIVNITDVGHMTDESQEDRMLLAAADEGRSPGEIAAKYTEQFLRDAERVNITPAAGYPRASDHIPEMIDLVQRLIDRGHAYLEQGTVYFDVRSFPAYGVLSHNSLDALRPGHRLDAIDHHKRHHADFVLWKAAGPRRVARYPSPWGEGYPGWHIECSAMSLAHLGEHVDVHTGGVDLQFPHHEDEIAQSEGALGHRVVGHWVHGEHLLFSGQKMAKSSGNVWCLDDVVARGHDPLAFRYLCLTARYRRQLSFTAEALGAAATALDRLRRAVTTSGPPALEPAGTEQSPAAGAADAEFRAAIDNDLDLPAALRVVWRATNAANLSPGERAGLVASWDAVLGLDLAGTARADATLPPGAAELLAARAAARAQHDYVEADRLRGEIAGLGVEVTDGPTGTTWRIAR